MADCLSQLVVKSSEGKYLLVETTSKKLHIASCRLREGEDFQSAALRCMNDVGIIILSSYADICFYSDLTVLCRIMQTKCRRDLNMTQYNVHTL